ncbi:hypothetical protein MHU86_19779 [Fragilaria crotonensis]|nr:hypothetical protein MHU86_19779 [Fragilaria crotonensis]
MSGSGRGVNDSSTNSDATASSCVGVDPVGGIGRGQGASVLNPQGRDDAFSQTYSRLKLCKRGHREALVERVCAVSFEDLPVWLWTLRLAEWSSIHIVDTDEVHLRQYHGATWEAIKSKLVIRKSYVGLGVDVWLVSGSLQFLCAQERLLVGEPMVGWLSDGGRRRPKVEGSQWSWFPVSHSRIGGVTKSTGMFGTIGFEPGIVVADDPIRRSIGHVIKHSERPKPCSLPFTKPHYITTDLLSVHQLHVPVVFPSGFSRTGWGQRPLIGSELAHAFDLPAFVAWESIGASNVIPIHMFRVVLDAVLATLAPAFQDRDGSHEKNEPNSGAVSSRPFLCRWTRHGYPACNNGYRGRGPTSPFHTKPSVSGETSVAEQLVGVDLWSALLFWRWNGVEQIAAARDGMRIHVQSSLPIGRKRMKRVKLSLESKKLVGEKIEGMQKRFYLEATGHVSNSLSYFAVPKGEADIRVVFDGSACGLNETLWAPNFFLPSANSAAMLLTFGTWMADMDFGEMFHNFPMEERMRRCSGIEFETRTEVGGSVTKMLRWTRLFMGMRPSPYIAVRYYYWGEEFARGNPARSDNPMGYDCIRLNLPGMSQFDPMLPKVMKWRTEAGVLAGDVITFVDDVRITGHSKETVTRCIVSSQAEFSI